MDRLLKLLLCGGKMFFCLLLSTLLVADKSLGLESNGDDIFSWWKILFNE